MNQGRRSACSHTFSRTPRSTHTHTQGRIAALRPEKLKCLARLMLSHCCVNMRSLFGVIACECMHESAMPGIGRT